MINRPAISDLPDLFLLANGQRVTTAADWPARRAELLEMVQAIEYGHIPPAPVQVTTYLLHPFTFAENRAVRGENYRLTCEPTGFSFNFMLVLPPGDGPFPVIVVGDGCWRYLTNDILLEAAHRGYAVALFNRTEIVPDSNHSRRDTGLYLVYPDGDFAALAAWAWGYHRVIDTLQLIPRIDLTRIIATGHSRGGKTALLAGLTDERIALTNPNNSGCGGAGSYYFPDEGAERLEDGLANFPYWFAARLEDYLGRANELPFDQHAVKALVAPRALLCTEALGDIWASPQGTYLTQEATREVYRLLGAEDNLGIWYREGGHGQGLEDWEVLLDFADWRLFGKAPQRNFALNPWAN